MQLADGAFLANDSPPLPIALACDQKDRLTVRGAVVLRHLDAQLLPRRGGRAMRRWRLAADELVPQLMSQLRRLPFASHQ